MTQKRTEWKLAMTSTKKWAVLVTIILGLLTLYVADRLHSKSSPMSDSAPLNRLTLQDGSGKMQPLAQWQGQPRLINFWAPWCAPCRAELPLLNQLYPEWHARQVHFIGIAMDQPDTVRAFARQHPLSYPDLIGQDDTLLLTRFWGNVQQGLPMTLLIGADDHIRWVKLGKLDEAELRTALTQLVRPSQP